MAKTIAQLHMRSSLTTEQLRSILKQASQPAPVHPALGQPAADGAGLVDAEKALDLALAGSSPNLMVA